ncbi:hypothetical protein [Marinoscillum sp.]|uniref:hypothetical protein n=1 Tax=Marinoscillum sp. TaxID=2024838 RepID=UPI003BAD5B49
MKKVKQSLLLIAVASMSVFMSCGPDDGGDKTEKEVLTEALVSTTWTADASVTDVSGVNGTFDIGTFTVKFTETADGLAFTLGGDISSYITGGTFSVSEAGDISNILVDSASAELSASVTSFVVNAARTSVSLNINVTEAGARVGGIGQYVLVFSAGS